MNYAEAVATAFISELMVETDDYRLEFLGVRVPAIHVYDPTLGQVPGTFQVYPAYTDIGTIWITDKNSNQSRPLISPEQFTANPIVTLDEAGQHNINFETYAITAQGYLVVEAEPLSDPVLQYTYTQQDVSGVKLAEELQFDTETLIVFDLDDDLNLIGSRDNLGFTNFLSPSFALLNNGSIELQSDVDPLPRDIRYASDGSQVVIPHYQQGTVTFEILFSSSDDDVDFNSLKPDQLKAVKNQANLYSAGSGDDVVVLPDISHFLIGGRHWDISQTFSGGDGNDQIFGGDGNDHINGGEGNDTLAGGRGSDALDGGAGDDTASYELSTTPVTIDLVHGTGAGGDADGDRLSNIENIIGSPWTDNLVGDQHDNILIGGEGDDSLKGGAGNDVIVGSSADLEETGNQNELGEIRPAESDTAIFSGASTDYEITELTKGYLQVRDLRTGLSNDGIDTLRDIKFLHFEADGQTLEASGKLVVSQHKFNSDTPDAALNLISTGNFTKWAADPGGGTTTITYSFAEDGGDFASDYFSTWSTQSSDGSWPAPSFVAAAPVAMQNSIRTIFDYLQLVTNLRFEPVDESQGEVGTIRFIGQAPLGQHTVDGVTVNTFGISTFPFQQPDVGARAGDVIVSSLLNQTLFLVGNIGWTVLAHEIGHALGLGHSDDRTVTSLMQPTAMQPGPGTLWNGFEPLDIAALQELYGKASSGVGDTDWTSLFGNGRFPFFDDSRFSATLWDSSGQDTLDWSAVHTHSVRIDLRQGQVTKLVGFDNSITATLGIAYGSVIENATGGSADDTFIGNSSNNVLDGGPGTDVAIYFGRRSDFELVQNDSTNWTIRDTRLGFPEGIDTLKNIEWINFVDAGDPLHPTILRLAPTKNFSDGYISGATIFADANNNGVLDDGEISSVTDGTGGFDLTGGSGPVVAFGGTDGSTGLAFQGHMSALEGSAVITPLTTLIVTLENRSVSNPEAVVLAAFGFDAGTDLTNLDPVAGTAGGDAQASLAYLRGVEVLDTLTLVASTFVGSDAGAYGSAFNAALDAMADLLEAHGSSLDLTSLPQIEELLASVNVAVSSTLGPAVIDGVAEVIVGLNQAIEGTSGAIGVDLLSALSAIGLVAQGAASDHLKDVADGTSDIGSAVDAYSGANLDAAIVSARSQTGDVDGPVIFNAPVGRDDAYSVDEDSVLNIDVGTGVLLNDTDSDRDVLTPVVVNGPAHGDLVLSQDGSFEYTPTANYSGPDSFTYKDSDGILEGNVVTVSLTVNAVNDPPSDVHLSKTSIAENNALGAIVGDLSAVDPDVGDTFTFSLQDNPGGLFSIDGAHLVVNEQLDYEGAQSHDITVRVTDATGASFDKELTISVVNVAGARITGTAVADIIDAGKTVTGQPLPTAEEDTIFGLAGNDKINGLAGNDVIEGGLGDDTLDGGAGVDTVSYAGSTIAVTVDLGKQGAQQDTKGAGKDILSNFERLLGSAKDDVLTGDANSNTIDGGTGNDTIEGGLGNDILKGGAGTDTLTYAHAASGVVVDLSIQDGNTAQSTNTDGSDTISGFENLTGSGSDDTLKGDGNVNVIGGGLGDDTISGGAGNDTLDGGSGASGTKGGNDTVDYSYLTAGYGITVTLGALTAATGAVAQTTTSGVAGDIDKVTNFENISGGDGNDVLTGNAATNTIYGGEGSDIIDGGAGNDTLNGDDHGCTTDVGQFDTVGYASAIAAVTVDLTKQGTAQNTGGAGVDTIDMFTNVLGSKFNDVLTGDSNDNTIEGGLGNDTLDGGGGNDIASYAGAVAGVTVSLTIVTQQDTKGAGKDTLSNFEGLLGSSKDDVLTGDGKANTLNGGAGNDILVGGAGADVLTGGGGIDTASYQNDAAGVTVDLTNAGAQAGGEAAGDTLSGILNLTGGNGADKLTGDGNANVLIGGAGSDILSGGGSNDTITGGDGNDTIDGGLGDDKLVADGGTVAGAGISDTVTYASISTNVTVSLAITAAQATGGAGKDTLSGFENLTGGSGNDTLTGDTKANVINGGDGDDVLIGGAGSDTLNGGNDGARGDTASWLGLTAAVTASLVAGTATSLNGKVTDTDTLIGIENLTGGTGADKLTGDTHDNIIEGGAGNDILDGGASSADEVFGDTASYASATAGVTVDLSKSGAQNTVGAGTDTLNHFENLAGGSGADTLSGDGNANLINGGLGNDILIGGLGVDTLVGGGGIDTASYQNDTVGVTVDLTYAGSQSSGEAAGDILSGIANLTGGSGADHLTGDGNANVILGGRGDDVLSGGAGNDTITGGDGNDIIDGGLGDDKLTADGGTVAGAGTSDTISYASIAVDVAVSLAITAVQDTKGAGKDTLSGFENLTGGSGNDMLTGDTKANVINGGDGDDVLIGGAGNDTLTGGNGNDLFRYNASTEGGDTIQDFTSVHDMISVVKSGFGIAAAVAHGGAGNNSFDTQYFTSGAAATAVGHGQFVFNDISHQLFWDSDGTGAKAAILIATLTNGATLHAADFELR